MKKIEIINLLKFSITLQGFNESMEDQGVYWHKKNIDCTQSLYIGFNGSLDRYFLQTPFVSIRFDVIEDKINNKSKELEIVFNEADYTIKSKSLENSEFDYSVFETRIDNKELFDKVLASELEYLNLNVFPFFEKYQNLNNVAELLSNLKPQEVVPYIQGAKLFCKTILILKESNHQKYEEKRNEYYEILKTQATKKEIYSEQLRLFEALFFI
jgi:hypothetical protein